MSTASFARRKVTVIGAGMVGGTVAQMLALRDYADVVLVDIVEGMPQGKSLDLMQMGTLLGFDTRLTGANSYEETAGSSVIVITSGIARKPGMSRDDLLKTNMGIVESVTKSNRRGFARCGRDRGIEPLGRHVSCRLRFGWFPTRAGDRYGGCAGFGPLPRVHRNGAGRFG